MCESDAEQGGLVIYVIYVIYMEMNVPVILLSRGNDRFTALRSISLILCATPVFLKADYSFDFFSMQTIWAYIYISPPINLCQGSTLVSDLEGHPFILCILARPQFCFWV